MPSDVSTGAGRTPCANLSTLIPCEIDPIPNPGAWLIDHICCARTTREGTDEIGAIPTRATEERYGLETEARVRLGPYERKGMAPLSGHPLR